MLTRSQIEQLSESISAAWRSLAGQSSPQAELSRNVVPAAALALKVAFLSAINTHNTPSWQLRVVMDGVRVPPYHYDTSRMLKVGHTHVIKRSALNRLFERGATILMDDAQTAIPSLDELCTHLTQMSGQTVAGTIFASPPHAEGFALHQDAEDAVIVQLHGRKAWSIFPPLARASSSMLKRAESGDPIIETELQPGDVLVMPKGSPHKTTSNSSEGSVHLTLGFYPIQVREVLLKVLEASTDSRLNDSVDSAEGRSSMREILHLQESEETLGELISNAHGHLFSRLRGDTNTFELFSRDVVAGGGQYRVLTQVGESVRLFLAAQLRRPDDDNLSQVVAALSGIPRGGTFRYDELASATNDSIVAEEALHAMLRMRFIAPVLDDDHE